MLDMYLFHSVRPHNVEILPGRPVILEELDRIRSIAVFTSHCTNASEDSQNRHCRKSTLKGGGVGDGGNSFPQPSERYYIGQKQTVRHMYCAFNVNVLVSPPSFFTVYTAGLPWSIR